MKPIYIYIVFLDLIGCLNLLSCSANPDSIITEEVSIIENQEVTDITEDEIPVLEERKSLNLTMSQKEVMDDLYKFSISFTSDICHSNGYENIICSPIGAEMVISMILNGIEKEYQDELIKYLGIKDINALNSLNDLLIKNLPKSDTSTSLSLSNALWWNTDNVNGLNSEYSNLFTHYYSGFIDFGDFRQNNEIIRNKINKWGYDNTNGRIQEYLKDLKADLYAIILNALSFNGYWRNELFNKNEVTTEYFYGITNNSNIKMMHSEKSILEVGEDDLFYYIGIPYGNGAFEMKVLLPKNEKDILGVENLITPERMSQLKEKSKSRCVKVNLPKFSINSDISISDILINKGMKFWSQTMEFTMFDTKKTGNVGLKQGLSLIVNEKGTEAAAITSSDICSAPEPDSEPEVLELTMNHPFYFFIQEFSTNAIIISGRISNL